MARSLVFGVLSVLVAINVALDLNDGVVKFCVGKTGEPSCLSFLKDVDPNKYCIALALKIIVMVFCLYFAIKLFRKAVTK
jgi:hypothetical protein